MKFHFFFDEHGLKEVLDMILKFGFFRYYLNVPFYFNKSQVYSSILTFFFRQNGTSYTFCPNKSKRLVLYNNQYIKRLYEKVIIKTQIGYIDAQVAFKMSIYFKISTKSRLSNEEKLLNESFIELVIFVEERKTWLLLFTQIRKKSRYSANGRTCALQASKSLINRLIVIIISFLDFHQYTWHHNLS